jgi:uncharacterized membrane protein SirB2
MKKKLSKILKIIPEFIGDILLILGIRLIYKGIYEIYIPAAHIALGICLLAIAFFIARKKVIANAFRKLNKQ